MNKRPAAIFVTGDRHVGKSTLVARLAERERAQGRALAGVLAHGLWEDGIRSGFVLEDLSTGTRTPLSRRVSPPGNGAPFAFQPGADEAIRRALAPARCLAAGVAVVDEVGRMELNGGGFAPLLAPLLALPVTHLWVVRTAFAADVAQAFSLSPICVDAAAPDALDRLSRLLDTSRGDLS
ncbi:nucleoside-triphosphatase THEP1 [Desulfobaculum xiamenense]|uniref:Nucleoside-triphosphatase THEP1 n=1 Tax=Desulfobaculum xiamenense TaxID=995050 RepID=A0A846QMY2_9BACT|nr:nucleoside-triphosphatase [Desulfobaculum xiamenense]NJB68547.1 nucleoside-triphosphatase THEP1 [Desulfobaculum xiamenense]